MSEKLLRQILSNQINIMLHLDSESDSSDFSEHIENSINFFMDKKNKEDCCDMTELKDVFEEKKE